MSRTPKDRHPIALAERTIAEALRVFSRHVPREGHRHVASPLSAESDNDQLIVMADERTLTAAPSARAMLVYEPAAMLLDMMRFDVRREAWAEYATGGDRHVGAMRGGVLVALATADRAEGRLSRIRVLVTPNFRQKGIGHLVLHRAVQLLLHDGLLPYARMAAMDLGARALARAAGFVSVTRNLTMPLQFAPL